MKESTRVLVALVAAVAGGALIGASGNPSLIHAADAIAPVGSLWVNAIRMTVIPLVVSLLITGVASASDVKAIGRAGGRSVFVFVSLLLLMSAIAIPLAALLFGLLPRLITTRPALPAGASEAASQIASGGQTQTVATWLTSMIPSNPIAAAANGAMLPLIIFTVLFALAISRGAPPARAALLGFFRALGDAMLILVRWVILLAPVGIFALMLPLAAHAGAGLVGAIGFYIVAYSVMCLVGTLLLYPVVALFGGIGVGRFARAMFEPQLIAVSSSSSIATLPSLFESAERSLALPTRVTGFVLPLSVSTFKVAAPVSWSVGALFIAWFYGVPLHPRELVTIGIFSVFMAFGAPGVPRGAFIALAPLFIAIGLPVEGVGILIAVDAIPDTLATMLNATGYMASTAIVARGDVESVPMAGEMVLVE
ncbi:MAG: dicarboxylate/amino acid:cation symporter [Gemmatimonadaceae bacterium]